jgi:hypothetical protein
MFRVLTIIAAVVALAVTATPASAASKVLQRTRTFGSADDQIPGHQARERADHELPDRLRQPPPLGFGSHTPYQAAAGSARGARGFDLPRPALHGAVASYTPRAALSARFRRATVFLWQRRHSTSGCPAKSLVSCQPGGSLLTCLAPCCVWMRPQRHTYSATT